MQSGFGQVIRHIGGVELYLYCTGNEVLYRQYSHRVIRRLAVYFSN